jgi:hypothetical protein
MISLQWRNYIRKDCESLPAEMKYCIDLFCHLCSPSTHDVVELGKDSVRDRTTTAADMSKPPSMGEETQTNNTHLYSVIYDK